MDDHPVYGFDLFPPVEVNFDPRSAELVLSGVVALSDGQTVAGAVTFHGRAAVSLLRGLSDLAARLDIDALEATMPRDQH